MRNNKLYQLSVSRITPSGRNKLLFHLRDSYTLLPNSLETLAKTLCPHLGSKGSIVHDEVQVSSLKDNRAQLLDYMEQDIRLLAGVMLRAQSIYWKKYNVDIGQCLTLSSLAMRIYRMNYYDQNDSPIYIPSSNQDAFIRRGYYGGHADTYKPYGENIYYYDVNSLYPYVMKTFAMPGGKPVWHGNLEVQIFSPISLFRFEKKADVDTFLIFFSSPWYNTNLVAMHTSRSYDTGKAKNAVVQRRSGGDFRPNKTSWFTSWQHGLLFVRLPLVCLS